MWNRIQRPETIVWIVVVAIAAIIGVAAVAVPPWPRGRPSHEEATVWITALTGAGTLAAVAVALWSGAASERRGERIRHDAVRPAITADISWSDQPMMWLRVFNWGQYPAINVRITVDIARPSAMTHRLPISYGTVPAVAIVLRSHREQAEVNNGQTYIQYTTKDPAVANGHSGHIVLWYEDILGWTWESAAEVAFGSDVFMSGTQWKDLDLGDPVPMAKRMAGWPRENAGEVMVK